MLGKLILLQVVYLTQDGRKPFGIRLELQLLYLPQVIRPSRGSAALLSQERALAQSTHGVFRMKLIPIILILALVGAASFKPLAAAADEAPPTQVTIEGYAFKAPSITVAAGTVVVWKNLDDDPHTVTAVDGSFDSGGLAQGDTFRHTFSKPGTYQYYCKVHPMMRGTVIVKEASS